MLRFGRLDGSYRVRRLRVRDMWLPPRAHGCSPLPHLAQGRSVPQSPPGRSTISVNVRLIVPINASTRFLALLATAVQLPKPPPRPAAMLRMNAPKVRGSELFTITIQTEDSVGVPARTKVNDGFHVTWTLLPPEGRLSKAQAEDALSVLFNRPFSQRSTAFFAG